MARPKKESHPFSIRMDIETYDKLNKFCYTSGQTKTWAIEKAINLYIDDYNEKMKKIKELTEK